MKYTNEKTTQILYLRNSFKLEQGFSPLPNVSILIADVIDASQKNFLEKHTALAPTVLYNTIIFYIL